MEDGDFSERSIGGLHSSSSSFTSILVTGWHGDAACCLTTGKSAFWDAEEPGEAMETAGEVTGLLLAALVVMTAVAMAAGKLLLAELAD